MRTLFLAGIILLTSMFQDTQEKPKEKPKEKEVEEVILHITVPKDCKITVNEKNCEYPKFQVLMEYTINAFVIEEMSYRGGQFQSLKMRSREAK